MDPRSFKKGQTLWLMPKAKEAFAKAYPGRRQPGSFLFDHIDSMGWLWMVQGSAAFVVSPKEIEEFLTDVDPGLVKPELRPWGDAFCTSCGGFKGHRIGCPIQRRTS